MRKLKKIAVSIAMLGGMSAAQAFNFDWAGASIDIKSRASIGAAMRMQDRNDATLGKQNIEGQQNLCLADDCLSLTGDPGPNQRLINARGAFFGTNRDDGNLNFDQYDIVTATSKLNIDTKVQYGDFLVRARVLGYFDPVNSNLFSDFEDKHVNTLYQPATTKRSKDVERYYAKGAELLDTYVQYSTDVAGHALALSVGRQTLRWGESGLTAVNSISEINPPNQVLLHSPGTEIAELFQPTNIALASFDLFEGVGMEVFYQLQWEPVKVDPHGSFFSAIDLFGNDGGEPVSISLGQFVEDPDGISRFAGLLGLISDSNATARVLPLDTGKPSDSGQYGAKLSYYADWLNDGTELGLYYMNYHSRLPLLSLYAADDSCARDSTALSVVADCGGLNTGGLLTGGQLFNGTSLTIDTLRVMLDYPENIHMFGVSFNTTAFGWSFSGEYSFRDNVPLQVAITDVILAGLQPTFPTNDIAIGTGALTSLLTSVSPALGGVLDGLGLGSVNVITLPSARHAIPDFLSTYRGYNNSDPNNRINAGQLVRGYERMKVGQFDFLGLQAFSNVLGADQILFIGEVSFTHILDMPDKKDLQFEGFGYGATHASPGADGTGNGGVVDTRRFNPTQQTKGFADDFAWGVRTLIRGEYNDVVFGWTFTPTIIGAWDIGGIASFPSSNFVEGRKEITAGTEVKITPAFTTSVFYQWFTGAGLDNVLGDRDNLALSFAYSF